MSFTVPDFALGNGARFKISASDVAGRDSAFTCPVGLSLKARNKEETVQPNTTDRWRPAWDNASSLNFAIRDGVRHVINGNGIADFVDSEDRLTHSQRRFLRHALELAQDLLPDASAAAGVEYELAEDFSTESNLGETRGTVTVWAHHLRSADGQVHEAVRLRLKRLREPRAADLDWTAIAALTLAYDRTAPLAATARIRISEFSLEDGELRCAFDGTRQDAVDLNAARSRPLLAALNGTVFRPGSACSGCAFLTVCPAVPQRRGILGIPGRAVATRHLTAADLHAYDRCPTAFLVQRRDHLPDAYADNADADTSQVARDRGLAVHAWLDGAHSRTPPRACAAADLPSPDHPDAAAVVSGIGLDIDAYRMAYPYLLQHLPRCPLGLDGLTGWTTERRVVVYDPDADVVVISTPDLTCEVGGSNDPIWRETKTAQTVPPDVEAAMHRYPAFALNVALLAAEVPERFMTAHAELEVLTPQASETFYVSISDGATVAYAQQLVADIARRFASDLTFDRKPSGACLNCSAHSWCDPPVGGRISLPPAVADDAEFANFDEPF